MAKNILPDKFKTLKARIKNEVNRRKHTGSVTSYGTTAYDYTNAPEAGKPIESEHYNKLVEPLRAINPASIIEIGRAHV